MSGAANVSGECETSGATEVGGELGPAPGRWCVTVSRSAYNKYAASLRAELGEAVAAQALQCFCTTFNFDPAATQYNRERARRQQAEYKRAAGLYCMSVKAYLAARAAGTLPIIATVPANTPADGG